MKLPVTGPICWTPRPDLYNGVIEYAGPYKNDLNKVRIVIALEHEDHSGREYKVHKIYPAQISPGTDLYRDIEAILRTTLLLMREFDLQDLVGRYCGVNVIQVRSAKYTKPFVTYDQIYGLERAAIESESPMMANLRKMAAELGEQDRRLREGQ